MSQTNASLSSPAPKLEQALGAADANLAASLARLFELAPSLQTIGLSATVADPEDLSRVLVPQVAGETRTADLIVATGGADPHVTMLAPGDYLPWAGHSAQHAFPQIYALLKQHKMTLVFVNTRMQAEMIFQALWALNDDNLPIALHHGSLDVEQRRKVENAMAASKLRAVVCTSSLDLGIELGGHGEGHRTGRDTRQLAEQEERTAPPDVHRLERARAVEHREPEREEDAAHQHEGPCLDADPPASPGLRDRGGAGMRRAGNGDRRHAWPLASRRKMAPRSS